MEKHIILIGYMGVGKSRVGHALSEKTGYPFRDLDEQIEAQAERDISEIFQEEGEEGFRERERKRLEELLDRSSPTVIATGGGTPCFKENLALMKRKRGFLVHLWAEPSIICERIGPKDPGRPKWKGRDEASVREHLEERMPYYRAADLSVDTGSRTPEKIAERILEAYWR